MNRNVIISVGKFILTILITRFIPGVYGADMASHDKRIPDLSHVSGNMTLAQLVSHPAFAGFGHHLLPRDSDNSRLRLPLREVRTLLPYHSAVDVPTVVQALNHMVDDVAAGRNIFYDVYSEDDKRRDPAKNATGLFFFRGKPGAPFALIFPGGGFSYVGSFHEGFPYAMELSKRGYNAFVLRYRVGGASPAVEDAVAALSLIFANAKALDVDPRGYSVWGSSAGARMAAYLGSYGAARFGGTRPPRPAAVIMAYTGHSEVAPSEPPTFAVVGDRDGIAPSAVMQRRIASLKAAGVDADIVIVRDVGHGFGLGVGTNAEGGVDKAIQFWQKHISG